MNDFDALREYAEAERERANRAEAKLARVRALADEWENEAGEDQAWLNGARVSANEARELPALIQQGLSHAHELRALLDEGES